MADTPYVVGDLAQTDIGSGASYGNTELRRKFDFGNEIAELATARDPLFYLVSKIAKKPVTDSIFKIKERRSGIHKRYAFPVGFRTWSGSGTVPISGYTTATTDIDSLNLDVAGTYFALKMGCDYKNAGFIQNIHGQSTGAISIGATDTVPNFYLENQVIRLNVKTAHSDIVTDDFVDAKIISCTTSSTYAYLGLEVIRETSLTGALYFTTALSASTWLTATYAYANGIKDGGALQALEGMKSYVIGNAYREGSGLPGYFKMDEYSTRFGFTQIVKHAFGMSGTAMSTEFDLGADRFAEQWDSVFRMHKWDIADTMYWSHQHEDTQHAQHTQGIVDFVLSSGNIFAWATTKSIDDFTDDLCTLVDPRYNDSAGSMVFLAPTATYNFFIKKGNFLLNNAKLTDVSTNISHFQMTSVQDMMGIRLTNFDTEYGSIRVIREPHLDGSSIDLLGVPLADIKYRPLAGNGKNRDTAVYSGVQTLETTGVDARVDLILTEFGMEYDLPEHWAVWKA